MDSDPPIIRFENVTKIFENGDLVRALDDVSFTIGQGERVAVMGQSGSGKSTLLNIICGLDMPTAGSIFFDGSDLARLDDDERTKLRREKIGMIFQTFNLLPILNGLENVALPLRLRGIGNRKAEKKAAEMLERVGLTRRMNHLPDAMSGGERQRIAIARALVLDPLVLLADEPTGNLDSHTGDEVTALLDELHDEYGMTVVLVTHNENAAAHCERLITLRDGRITGDHTRR